jgi:hypothetical protein
METDLLSETVVPTNKTGWWHISESNLLHIKFLPHKQHVSCLVKYQSVNAVNLFWDSYETHR